MTITFLHDLKPLPNDYADDMVLNNEIGKRYTVFYKKF